MQCNAMQWMFCVDMVCVLCCAVQGYANVTYDPRFQCKTSSATLDEAVRRRVRRGAPRTRGLFAGTSFVTLKLGGVFYFFYFFYIK